MQDPTNDPASTIEARGAEGPGPGSLSPSHVARVAAQISVIMAERSPLTAEQVATIAEVLDCPASELLTPAHEAETIEAGAATRPSEAKAAVQWHPLWCRVTECDGEEHLGQETRWQPASDDVTVLIHSRRWDEGERGAPGYCRGIPKVRINFENIGATNLDGSIIRAEADFDAAELRLLLRFLQRELDKIEHFAGDDMPVDVAEGGR